MPLIQLHEKALREIAADCNYSARCVAERLEITVRHLRRVFKARLSASPGAWLREQRLLRARELLADGTSVKSVAYQLGFHHASQFSRDFKARFGYSPSADLGPASRRLP